jgi:SulP family sulfate permease
VLAGIIQILAGLFKLEKLMRIVPHPVIYGFVNGLAIIIFMSQLNQFKDASGNWLTGQSLYILVGLVLLTMLIIWGYPSLQKLSCFINQFWLFWCFGFGIDTKTVGDIASIQGGFPPFHIPNIPFNLETLVLIFHA